MGTRYIIEVKCPKCGHIDNNCYYATTCGFLTWECSQCYYVVDLEKYTGITTEEASNKDVIMQICKKMRENNGGV